MSAVGHLASGEGYSVRRYHRYRDGGLEHMLGGGIEHIRSGDDD
jgi:hypothetical protein